MEMLKEFLLSSAGIGFAGIVLGYLFKLGVDYIKGTETKKDDKILEIGIGLLIDILNQYDLGTTEVILRKALTKAQLIDGDTTEVEKVLNKKLDDVTKK